jgi:hypothetical protein
MVACAAAGHREFLLKRRAMSERSGAKRASPGSGRFAGHKACAAKKPIADLIFLLLFVSRQKVRETLLAVVAIKFSAVLL